MGSCWSGDGGASWCIQLGRTAIHFPQLVIYGTAKQREAGVHGTGPPELVHCPAPSCFTTQRAGLPNLRWQTVTYITPPSGQWRLVVFERLCIHSRFYPHVTPCPALHRGILFFFSSPSLSIWSFMLHFCTSFCSLSLPLSLCGPNVKWLCLREVLSRWTGSWGLCPSVQGNRGRSQ